jgi:hypothetical protein
VAENRLALNERGEVHVQLKTAYRNGTTHVLLEPLDFLARLAALVPPPRVHLTRYHGVFAPASALRAAITPAGRGRRGARQTDPERRVSKHAAMTWMQRLKRVSAIDIERCRRCGGKLMVIASIEDPSLIERILAHPPLIEEPAPARSQRALPRNRRCADRRCRCALLPAPLASRTTAALCRAPPEGGDISPRALEKRARFAGEASASRPFCYSRHATLANGHARSPADIRALIRIIRVYNLMARRTSSPNAIAQEIAAMTSPSEAL